MDNHEVTYHLLEELVHPSLTLRQRRGRLWPQLWFNDFCPNLHQISPKLGWIIAKLSGLVMRVLVCTQVFFLVTRPPQWHAKKASKSNSSTEDQHSIWSTQNDINLFLFLHIYSNTRLFLSRYWCVSTTLS